MGTIGHNMTNAPKTSDSKPKHALVQREIMGQGTICRYWILLDTDSTIDIIKDTYLLVNGEMRCNASQTVGIKIETCYEISHVMILCGSIPHP